MWTNTSMTFAESLTLSAMGLCVVVSALASLAIIIMLFSKVMTMTSAGKAPAAVVAAAAPPAPEVSDETAAIVLSVICEELKAAPEELQITGIRKI